MHTVLRYSWYSCTVTGSLAPELGDPGSMESARVESCITILCPVGLTTATPCYMVLQFGTCSSSRECRTVLLGWSPGLVALHLALAPPLHHSLHWLPISLKIQFKILTLTYKTLSSGKPSYLANLIHLATPNRNLHFNKGPLLSASKCKTKTGTRVFSVCAPSLWNKLPLSIRSFESLTCFRQRLKTHLFGLAYPP